METLKSKYHCNSVQQALTITTDTTATTNTTCSTTMYDLLDQIRLKPNPEEEIDI